MQKSSAVQELQHITFDLGFFELHVRILKETGQIVFHVRSDHIYVRFSAIVACDFVSKNGLDKLSGNMANLVLVRERYLPVGLY